MSTLTDRDEHALEAIRRQLDVEFPHWSGSVEPAHGDAPPPAQRTAPAARRVATTVGTLLLACAAGSAAGVLVTILYAKHVVAPTVARESSTPVTVTRPPRPASPPAESTAERTDARPGTLVERPRLTTPPPTPRSRPAAAAAPTRPPEIVPETVSPSPPAAPPLTPDPPDTWQVLAEPPAAPPAIPDQFRHYLERFKHDVEQAHGAPTQRAGPAPQAP